MKGTCGPKRCMLGAGENEVSAQQEKKKKKKADLYILFKILIKERKLYMYIFCLMDLVESNNHRVKSHCKYFNMTCAFFSF